MQLKKIKRVLLLFFLVWNEVWGSVIALNISSGGGAGAGMVWPWLAWLPPFPESPTGSGGGGGGGAKQKPGLQIFT